MKFLTRTIIMLVAINLIIVNFALAQEAPAEPPRLDRRGAPIPSQNPEPMESAPSETPMGMVTISGRAFINDVVMTGLPGNPVTDQLGYYTANVPVNWTGVVKPMKNGFVFKPTERFYNRVTGNITKENYIPKGVVQIPVFNKAGSREILIIPATDIKAENLAAITEDLQVMTHIFDEKFKEPQEIQGVFVDFGDIFGRDSRKTEAIYIQGYGALFLMEVNFAFSPEPETEEKQIEKTEDIDPIWQRARRKIFAPSGYSDHEFEIEQKYSPDKIEQLKQELTRTLKHAANIRNIQPDEVIILTVIGKARQTGGMYQYNFSRSRTPRTRTSSSRGRSSSRTEGGMYGMGGGMGGSMGGMGGGMGGMGGGMGGMGGGMSGMGGGMGGMGGGMMGGGSFGGGMMMGGGMMGGMGGFIEDYSETGSAPATVLTIRAKKSDVDDFAKGEIDFKQFQEKVDIFTY